VTDERIALRHMTPEDLDRVALIQQACPEAARWDPPDYLKYRGLVAELGGEIAGFAVVRDIVPGEIELLNLAVLPALRRRGVGGRLLSVLAAEGNDIYLEVRESNHIAQELYLSAGFRLIGRRPGYYESPPEDAIVMLRQKC